MSVRYTHHVLLTVYHSMKHVIDWSKAKVVNRETQRQTRWIKEALWIKKTGYE